VADVVFTDAAVDDLRRFGPMVAPRVLQRVLTLEADPDPGVPLVDPATGFRRLTAESGRWRVVFDTSAGVVTIHELWGAGTRLEGEAYAEALDRMQAADPPDLVQLARVLRRLGRVTGSAPVPRNRVPEPVPDWLADALVRIVGMSPLEVAALDARSAFDTWNARR
jgi:mRNA interferase RelE/StbE